MTDYFAVLTVSGLCTGIFFSASILTVLSVLNTFTEIAK